MIKLALALWLLLTQPDPVALPNCGVASQRVKLAHRYHGILWSIEDPSGEQFFIRKGERCKLFTQAFEAFEARLREKEGRNETLDQTSANAPRRFK